MWTADDILCIGNVYGCFDPVHSSSTDITWPDQQTMDSIRSSEPTKGINNKHHNVLQLTRLYPQQTVTMSINNHSTLIQGLWLRLYDVLLVTLTDLPCSYLSAHKASMQCHFVLSHVVTLACPHDLHPSTDLSFSMVLFHVIPGLPSLALPSGTHWSAVMQSEAWSILNTCPIHPPPPSQQHFFTTSSWLTSLRNLHLKSARQ